MISSVNSSSKKLYKTVQKNLSVPIQASSYEGHNSISNFSIANIWSCPFFFSFFGSSNVSNIAWVRPKGKRKCQIKPERFPRPTQNYFGFIMWQVKKTYYFCKQDLDYKDKGCIHLLNTRKYYGNTCKYWINTYKYWANTWKMCSPASVILASIVTILVSFEAILIYFKA